MPLILPICALIYYRLPHKITNSEASTMLFIPAVNSMFEIAKTRFAIRNIHPPLAVFGLLIVLAILSCFLSGYSTVGKRAYNFIYIVSYVAITAFTIYVIIDLELPRVGLIRVDNFDFMMVEVRSQMNEELTQKMPSPILPKTSTLVQ